MIWKNPACEAHAESFRYQEVIDVKSPVEAAERMSMNRVPFIGSGVPPLLRAEPLIDTFSLIPSRLAF